MSHSPALIRSITSLLQEEYPASLFRYVTEKAIPDTRMYPDIQVYDQNGRLICVAEIGYTRPEKLTAYRQELKIPDVRWYDKKGRLHADVDQRVVRVTVETEPTGMFAVYLINDIVDCDSETCEESAVCEWNASVMVMTHVMTEDEEWRLYEQTHDYLAVAVTAVFITDYSRVWICCYCDKCGATWKPSKGDSMHLDVLCFELAELSAKDFARQWGGRRYFGDWIGAAKWLQGYLGETVVYQDGEFLSEQARTAFDRSVNALRLRALKS